MSPGFQRGKRGLERPCGWLKLAGFDCAGLTCGILQTCVGDYK
jgi:hypothetical protein